MFGDLTLFSVTPQNYSWNDHTGLCTADKYYNVKIMVIWGAMPCHLVDRYQYFGGTCQNNNNNNKKNSVALVR
jgi:hypothetical protein